MVQSSFAEPSNSSYSLGVVGRRTGAAFRYSLKPGSTELLEGRRRCFLLQAKAWSHIAIGEAVADRIRDRPHARLAQAVRGTAC